MDKKLKKVIDDNQHNYSTNAYLFYSVTELEWWVKLLTKRAGHRSNVEKRDKDLKDAANYQLMADEARTKVADNSGGSHP